jgi:hypothetical protein
MTYVYTNNAVGTVTGGGTNAPGAGTVQQWTVSTTTFQTALTNGDYFHVADPSSTTEKIKVTAISGAASPYTWTTTRGDDGTTPVTHATNFTVYQVASASDLMNPGSWVNVKSPQFGATGNNSTDDSTAIQAALNYIAGLPSGGTLYVPAGDYKIIASGLSYTATTALRIVGDGPSSTNIHQAGSATGFICLSVSNAIKVRMENFSIRNDTTAASFTDTNIGISLTGIDWASLNNVVMQTGASPNRVNQCIVMNTCTNVDIDCCDLRGYVNSVVIAGYTQCVNIRDGSTACNDNTGVATASNILMQDTAQTLHMVNQVINSGDRGLLCTSTTGGANPAFVWLYDVEVNNTIFAGFEFDNGAEVWITACGLATNTTGGGYPGISFGTNFQGTAYMSQCFLVGWPGHSISIQGGNGFGISDCTMGGSGGGKYQSNLYDEINIQGTVNFVTISGCHFNTDPYFGFAGTHPRSAIYVESGASEVLISDCISALYTSYGTTAFLDHSGIAVKNNTIGLGWANTYAGVGNTITASSFGNLTLTPTIPSWDPRVNDVYRVIAWGHGTEASGSAQNLTLRLTFMGVNLGSFVVTNNPPASGGFSWQYIANVIVLSTGTGGSINANESFSWANNLANNHSSLGTTINTQSAGLIGLYAQWASTSGSPTITCDGFTIEKIQNVPLH